MEENKLINIGTFYTVVFKDGEKVTMRVNAKCISIDSNLNLLGFTFLTQEKHFVTEYYPINLIIRLQKCDYQNFSGKLEVKK